MLSSRWRRWFTGYKSAGIGAAALGAVALSLAPFVGKSGPETTEKLLPVNVDSAVALERSLDALGYQWPPGDEIPRIGVHALPEDLAELPVAQRKSVFFRTITPLVLAENARLSAKRARIIEVAEGAPATDELRDIAARYGTEGDLTDPETVAALLRRVDEIPLGMALAQAAIESGWGTSRFTREARNLFGVWTWDSTQGIEPLARPAGATHFVRVFPDLQHSVRNFLFTLNTGHTYTALRAERERLRLAEQPLDSHLLAGGLEKYSQRGEAYVREVRAMIRSNQLDRLDHVGLSEQLPERDLLRQ